MRPARLPVVLVPLALATAGCPFGEGPRQFAAWEVRGAFARFGCAQTDAWVSRSGRQGVGITVRVYVPSDAQGRCAVSFEALELRVHRDLVVPADRLPPAVELSPGAEIRAYVAFAFDDDRAFANDGDGIAGLGVRGRAGGAPVSAGFELRRAGSGR